MSAAPWMKFYPRDWRGDQALRAVSISARGLWMECLCIMHEAKPYGHLALNGEPVGGDALARMAGVPVDEANRLMAELRQAGVLSVTRNGVVFSRRMTKDHARAQKGKASVEKRWKNRNSDDTQAPDAEQKSGAPNRYPNRTPTTQKPEARSQNRSSLRSERVNGSADQIEGEFAIFWAAYPRRGGSNPKAPALQCYRRCRKRGISAEMMLDAVRQYAKERAGEPPRFTVQATTWLNQSRWEQESAPLLPQKPVEPPEWASMRVSDPSDWPSSLPPFLIVAKAYTAGNWASAWGPEPDYGGCRLPIDLQRRLAVERFGEDVARRRAPRLFAVAA